MDSEMVVHNGGCHCRRVRWRARSPASVVVWQCNCSDCSMRRNTHFVVPFERSTILRTWLKGKKISTELQLQRFELLGDSENFISTYTFGTNSAKHTFCKVCGITSFYTPRSNKGIAITYRCVDPGTLSHVEIKHFDGMNWEKSQNETDPPKGNFDV